MREHRLLPMSTMRSSLCNSSEDELVDVHPLTLNVMPKKISNRGSMRPVALDVAAISSTMVGGRVGVLGETNSGR